MRPRQLASRKAAILRLVELEGRDVPAIVNWTLGANGDFANAAAWTDASNGGHHVPGPTDDAVIPSTFVVTSSANQTVNSLNATGFQILAGNFTIGGANNASTLAELTVASAATLALTAPTGLGTINITAGFDDVHAAHIAGALTAGPTGTIRLQRGWIYLDPGVGLLGSGQYLMNGDSTGSPEVILNSNVMAPTNLALTNGLVRGTTATNTLTIPTGVTTNWVTTATAGSSITVPTVVQSNATLVVGGQHDEFLGAVLTNSGTVAYQQATGPNSTGLALGANSRIDNLSGATLRLQPGTGTAISGTLPAVINNGGTISTTGTTINNVTVNNSGVLNVQSGVLDIAGGGGTHSGQFTINTGGALSFTAGATVPVLLNSGTLISGQGPVSFNGTAGVATQLNVGAGITSSTPVSLTGGTLKLNTPLTLNTYSQSGGTLDGAAPLTLSGPATWTGGTMQGGGTTAIATDVILTMSGNSQKSLSQRTLSVAGTVNHTGGTLDLGTNAGTVISIQPQGAYNLAADVPISGAGGSITNQGTFTKSTPNGAGGTSAINHNFTNAGTLRVNNGTLFLQQSFVQSGGQTIVVPGANLRATTFQLNGGVLSGTGPINANVTGTGTISPGSSPGTLTINGNVNLSGAVVIELNGTTPGTQYDQMDVNGGVNIGGTTLMLTLGYVPSPGDGYIIVSNDGSDPIAGTFTGLPEGATITLGGTDFHISYHAGDGNDIALTSLAVPPPGALTTVNDGAAQRSRVTSIQVTFSTVVTFASPLQNAFQVVRTGPGGPIGNVTFTVDPSASTATQTIDRLTFSGAMTEFGSLIDGDYTLTVFSSQVSAGGAAFDGNLDGTPGGDLTMNFYRLYGDVNGDRAVNGLDLAEFRSAFGTAMGNPNYRDYLDANGDGVVNGLDLAQFRTRFGTSLP
jgi:hypothetical protein